MRITAPLYRYRVKGDRVVHIPPESFPGLSRLYSDYLTRPQTLRDFYIHGWKDPASYVRAAKARLASYGTDRAMLAGALEDQNRTWECGDRTLKNIGRLRQPETLAVVTGQQAGIAGGPAYTVYKALTAVRLAGALEAQLKRPVVPVFWMVSDDHDTAEIDHIALPGADGEPVTVRYAVPEASRNDSVLGLRLEETSWEPFRKEIGDCLPETEFSSGILGMLEQAYEPGRAAVDAFARLAHLLLREYGIIIADPARNGLKAAGRDVFRKELENPLHTTGLVARAGKELAESGYHGQIRPNPEGVNLFLREDGTRYKIRIEDGVPVYADTPVSAAELLSRFEQQPDAFSTGVVLRPVLQDYLLPTVAYVGGPGEIAYFAQLKEVYGWCGVPMPVIVPRNGFTLVERPGARVMEKHKLKPEEFFTGPDDLLGRLLRTTDLDRIVTALQDLEKETAARLQDLAPLVMAVDPTLTGPLKKTAGGAAGAFRTLEKKTVAASKRSHETLARQLRRTAGELFPEGVPQERVYSILRYLNQAGPDLTGRLHDAVEPFSARHTVIYL